MPAAKRYYPAATACNLCGVTQRMLDYWAKTGVVQPDRVFECEYKQRQAGRRKAYHLFTFETLVQIKIVKNLRDAGLSLERIRYAIRKLRKNHGDAWQRAWIVIHGKSILRYADSLDGVESLMKGETGQLVFPVIALGATKERIETALQREPNRYRPFAQGHYRGRLKHWSERTISA